MKLRKKRRRFSRRGFLRGAAATTIGLPLLNYMLDDHGTAYADGGTLPCRYLQFHSPTSLNTSDAPSSGGPDGMTPTTPGMGYEIGPVLQPLADMGLTGDVSVISGLFAPAFDAPGGYDSDYHGLGVYACMTGRRHGWDPETWFPYAPSADQVVADAIGDQTRFASLIYQIDPVRTGYSLAFNLSGSYNFMEAQTSPAQAYRALFTGWSPADPTDPDPGPSLETRLRVSSLSYAGDEIRSLQSRLGAVDRQRMEQHLEQIRALENRLSTTMMTPTGTGCADPMFADTDPEDLAPNVPDQAARSALFADLIQMAFACDMTRSVNIAGADRLTGSGMAHEQWASIGGLHGELQHTAPQAALDEANRWFVEQYAGILRRLKEVPEGTGNVLDRTAAAFLMEGGKAGRGADGGGDANHSTDNMVMLLGGHAGGLVAGQHIVETDEHPAKVLNTALRAMGVTHDLGDISGIMNRLFAAP